VNALPEGITGKALALGICALLLATLYFVTVAPLIAAYGDGERQLQERRDVVERLQATVHDLPRLRALAGQWKEKSSVSDLLLPSANDAVAAARLQALVRDLVTQAGAALTTTEVLAPQTQDPLHKVGIHVAFSANLKLLAAVLKGVETAHPLLFIDNLDVRGAERSDEASADPSLTVAFDVYGFPTPASP
jgi:hypothetical protein